MPSGVGVDRRGCEEQSVAAGLVESVPPPYQGTSFLTFCKGGSLTTMSSTPPPSHTPFIPCNFDSSDSSDDQTHLLEFLRKQIEFYLSDANLVRDDFFSSLILSNSRGLVPLDAFLKCNRVKKAMERLRLYQVNELRLLSQALQDSETLILHRSRNAVSRRVPFTAQSLDSLREIHERRSVYVENLDPKIRETDLQKIFVRFGRIAKISASKISPTSSQRCSFIEFETEEAAIEALDSHNEIPLQMMRMQHVTKRPLRVFSRSDWNKAKAQLKRVTSPVPRNRQTPTKVSLGRSQG